MSVTVSMTAIRPPDETWKKHAAVWAACEAAGVEVPAETCKFFDYEKPHPDGVTLSLGSMTHPKGAAVQVEQAVQIHLDQLPDGVRLVELRWS